MKNLIKTLFLLLATTILGCSYNIQLKDFHKGETLYGNFTKLTHEVWIVMPDGIKLSGKYVEIRDDRISFGLYNESVFSGTSFGTFSASGSSSSLASKSIGYAILRSPDTKLMMEVLFEVNLTTGMGEARTNDDRNYKIIYARRGGWSWDPSGHPRSSVPYNIPSARGVDYDR